MLTKLEKKVETSCMMPYNICKSAWGKAGKNKNLLSNFLEFTFLKNC